MKKSYYEENFRYLIVDELYLITDGADTIKEAREICSQLRQRDARLFPNSLESDVGSYKIFRSRKGTHLGKQVF